MRLPEASMSELLAPASHSINERKRVVAPLAFVQRLATEAPRGGSAGESPAQRDGRRYETRVRRWLARCAASLCLTLHDHIWLEYRFSHENFNRKAQPDFLLTAEDGSGYLFEVKRTWVDTSQQLALYTTLLQALSFDLIPATICRNFTPETPRDCIVRKIDDIVPGSIMLVRL